MALHSISHEFFNKYIAVPRETYNKFELYVNLVEKWQRTINLVGTATIQDIWIRHIIDSAQLYSFIDKLESKADLGSGAGFPGLVLGIMGAENIALVESDKRKSAFLKEAARVTNTTVNIINERVEAIDLKKYLTLFARGFARLINALDSIETTLTYEHKLLLLKGKNYNDEIEEARHKWQFDCTVTPSITDSHGAILALSHIIKRR